MKKKIPPLIERIFEWKGIFALIAFAGLCITIINGLSQGLQRMADIDLQHILMRQEIAQTNQKITDILNSCMKK